MADLELEVCGVTVSQMVVVLAVKTTAGDALTLTMPRMLGERLMQELPFDLTVCGQKIGNTADREDETASSYPSPYW